MKRLTYKGFGLLELSKLVMYDFHDFLIRRTYKDQAMFLFTDTDSLIYHITKQHIYLMMWKFMHPFFIISIIPRTIKYTNCEVKKRVIGKFKNELHDECIWVWRTVIKNVFHKILWRRDETCKNCIYTMFLAENQVSICLQHLKQT